MVYRNYSRSIFYFFLLISVGFVISCKKNETAKIQLFAATGSLLPTKEISNSFESKHNILINNNYSASGILARQIKTGAEADIFISANKEWIDYLIVNKLLNEKAVTTIAINKLVLICYKNNNINITFTKEFDIKSNVKNKIAIGDPNYVPAGKYAKQVFDTLNWYSELKEQMILTKDVTSTLHLVEQRECDWGIVYLSEALKSDKVKIYTIPEDLHEPVIFYMGKLNNKENTQSLYEYFKSETADKIFNKFGFN